MSQEYGIYSPGKHEGDLVQEISRLMFGLHIELLE